MSSDDAPAVSEDATNDLFAETLLKIEATIEGSRTFLLGFLRTAWNLAVRPLRVETLLAQAADPRRRTKPLTFMVVSVVGGSVAMQTILGSLINEVADPDHRLDLTELATAVFRAYSSLTFGQVIVEALPITVLALIMTSWLFPLVRVEGGLGRRLGDVVSYSIGLQFSLILVASLLSMPLIKLGQSPQVEVASAVVGWAVVAYVMCVPGFIISVPLRSATRLSMTRKTAIVAIGLLVSSGLVLLDVAYLVVRSAIGDAVKTAAQSATT